MSKTREILILGTIFALVHGTLQMIFLQYDIRQAIVSTSIGTPVFVVLYYALLNRYYAWLNKRKKPE